MNITRGIDLLESHASPRLAVFLIMVVIPVNAFLLPYVNSMLGAERLDSQFFVPPAQIFQRLQAYGELGRTRYLISIFTLDWIYPLLYTSLIAVLLTMILKVAFDPEHPFHGFHLLPAAMLICAFLENIAVAALLLAFPAQPLWLGWIVSGLSTIKWCFGGFSALAFLIGIVRFLLPSSPSQPSGV